MAHADWRVTAPKGWMRASAAEEEAVRKQTVGDRPLQYEVRTWTSPSGNSDHGVFSTLLTLPVGAQPETQQALEDLLNLELGGITKVFLDNGFTIQSAKAPKVPRQTIVAQTLDGPIALDGSQLRIRVQVRAMQAKDGAQLHLVVACGDELKADTCKSVMKSIKLTSR